MTAKKGASSARTLTVDNLVALGAERLAELLLAQAEQDKVFARTLKMALVAKDDPEALAHAIGKRLKTIGQSRSFIEWNKTGPLARELHQLRESIAGSLARIAPHLADQSMRRLLGLAGPVLERADDSNGDLGDVFRQAGADLGVILGAVGVQDKEALAADILSLIEGDPYGVFDVLPEAVSPALGHDGRAAMRRMILDRQAHGNGQDRRKTDYRLGWLLPMLADLDNDVDAFIATVDPERKNALINAQVARRLIGHGRSTEALEWLDAATERGGNDQERETLRLAALESLGRKEEAQQQRRLLFERWLDPVMLRAWLKALPDFEDFDAEQEALDFVMRFSDATQALAFLVEWPDMHRADRLVHQRLADLDGKDYGVLRPSAEALEAEYPSAAALLYRRLVESVLDRGSSKYYVYAVRDWHAAGALASRLSAQSIPAHADWVGAVRARHGRKAGFWNAVGAQSQ